MKIKKINESNKDSGVPLAIDFQSGYRIEEYDEGGYLGIDQGELCRMLRDFAKIHVEAALKSIIDGGLDDISAWDGNPYSGEGSDYLDEQKVRNKYPLDNIK